MKMLLLVLSVLGMLGFGGCGSSETNNTTTNNYYGCCDGVCNDQCGTDTNATTTPEYELVDGNDTCNTQCSSDEVRSNYYYNVYYRLSTDEVTGKHVIHTTIEVIVPPAQSTDVDVLEIIIRKNMDVSNFEQISVSHSDMNLSKQVEFDGDSDDLVIDLVPNLGLGSDPEMELHYSINIDVVIKEGSQNVSSSSNIFEVVDIKTRCSTNIGGTNIFYNDDTVLR